MKATVSLLATLLVLGAASSVHADPFSACCLPQAPNAYYGGVMTYNPYGGGYYGAGYSVRPPWEPFNGARPLFGSPQNYAASQALGQQGQAGGTLAFPTHPFARSPRDFFMVD